ncbi:hypothetical protein OIU34_08120 [Pararhizobium sp. BT-229]|uniref:hypothetical protein n=1 Tax=Pararhizobium sp. BT-229 TaxID=2986923 RepID=UPI0021F6C0A9|nr:hypothetical protein [Pararhizobium sp. BT-229]MCV9961866.1 hypothetical protein [Pararhizobium sp. BT-229]
MQTIAACRGYQPEEDATTAHLPKAASAIIVDKSNLNRFAVGLVAMRPRRGPPTRAEAVGRFVAETGPTHIVVNNAGIQFRR